MARAGRGAVPEAAGAPRVRRVGARVGQSRLARLRSRSRARYDAPMKVGLVAMVLAFASGCYCAHRADRFTFVPDDAGRDGGSDAGDRGDAGAERDAGADGGHDAGALCLTDPSTMGLGSCTSNLDCVAHCNPSWDVGCAFGAYGRADDEGVCIYRDCRSTLFFVELTSQCPESCPELCGFRTMVACPSTPGRCAYTPRPDGG